MRLIDATVSPHQHAAIGRAVGRHADGQARPLLVEGLDHGQALLEAGDQVALQRSLRADCGDGHIGFRVEVVAQFVLR